MNAAPNETETPHQRKIRLQRQRRYGKKKKTETPHQKKIHLQNERRRRQSEQQQQEHEQQRLEQQEHAVVMQMPIALRSIHA